MIERIKNFIGKTYTIYFLVTGFTCILGFLLLFLGNLILQAIGLQWRNWVHLTLASFGIGGAWFFSVGLIVFLLRKIKGSWKVRLPAAMIAIALIVVIVILSLYVPFFLAFEAKTEAVVEWNGQKCVTSDIVWHHIQRDWYEYHGIFVMGKESIHSEQIR